MNNFDLRFLGVPNLQNMLTARPNMMPMNMLTGEQAQPTVDLTQTGSITSKETVPQGGIGAAFESPQGNVNAPVAVGMNDLNYFPPQPAANAAPITQQDYQASLRHLQPQNVAQQPAKAGSGVSGGLDVGNFAAFLQGLGRGNGVLSAIGGGMGAVQERKQENQTVKYLTSQGISDAEAQVISRNPQAVYQVMQNIRKGADPKATLELQKLGLEVENLRNPQVKPTSDIQEYNFAKEQGYQGSFAQYQIDMKKAGSTQTNVSLNGEKAWEQESAKLFAKRYDDIAKQASNSRDLIGMYDLAEQALGSGVRTGFGAETELNLRQMGASMGLDTDPEKLSGGELIRAVQNRMSLIMRSPDGGMGMPGALSDRDIKFLKDSQVGLDRSPEGNMRMLKSFRALEERKLQLAQLADQYVEANGRLDAGFNRAVREYAEKNPLFPDAPTPTNVGGSADPLGIR